MSKVSVESTGTGTGCASSSNTMISQLKFLLDHFLFCLRSLADLGSDLTFRFLYSGTIKRTLPPVNDHLVLLSSTTLARKIRHKELSSETVVRAFVERIREVQPFLNAVVDQRFDQAIDEARKVDRIVASVIGPEALSELARESPFLGVPFSCKEGFRVRGLHQSNGIVSRTDVVSSVDASVVSSLKRSGAIVICVTNVSENGMWWESVNGVYGRTNNPYDLSRTPGGSSGGEAALQASAGVAISLGSDTGGSIRTPAAFCGLFGHKPSAGIVSLAGVNCQETPPDYKSDLQTVGPLCRHAEDLIPVFSVLLDGVARKKLRLDDDVQLSKLSFYYMDGGVGSPLVSPVEPEVKQALIRVVNYVEDTFGIQVQPVRFPLMRDALAMFTEMVSIETKTLDECGKTTVVDINNTWSLMSEWRKWILRQSSHILPCLVMATMGQVSSCGQTISKAFRSLIPGKSKLHSKVSPNIETLRNQILELLGDEGVLICPPHPTVAIHHNQSYTKPFNFLYTAIFNVLGCPATVVPTGLSRNGLPLSVQVVAAPMNDRVTLAVAKALERPFGGWIPPFVQDPRVFY